MMIKSVTILIASIISFTPYLFAQDLDRASQEEWEIQKTEKIRVNLIKIVKFLQEKGNSCGVDEKKLGEIYQALNNSNATQPHSLVLEALQDDQNYVHIFMGLDQSKIQVNWGPDADDPKLLNECKYLEFPELVQRYNPGTLEFHRILSYLSTEHFIKGRVPKVGAIFVMVTSKKSEALYRTNREQKTRVCKATKFQDNKPTIVEVACYYIYLNLGDNQLGVSEKELVERLF